ncbi:InlB B-repeat-containing protein [Paenibacillus sp. CGMCC 1.16610]|uniref:DNRLRE domain-containing protein n=1 Tax=Paenibacillus anseongense TaxID=2682845 RepID=A0ABW9U6H2_9BACL|nr:MULTISPECIES: InlB B-repeat-containing protein [Paenibacillus]MBA2938903.1 InlB B-repeat-containing protein [Paenibacillus sp. CGMCC 1.16610]MVQ34865.1 DNRLRE domain-containing protein [Paenibacillus anseongense]
MRISKICRKMTLLLLITFMLAMMLPQNTELKAEAAEVAVPGTFYVDYSNGQDTNDGTTPETAWKTLDKVNATQFGPGNKILFKSGEIWFGQLWPKGSGAEGSPIIIDKYGEGDKPKIDAEGLIQSAVKLDNQEYWEINNLAVTNWRTTKTTVPLTTTTTFDVTGYLAGIRVTASGREGAYKHIVIRDCYIHDINGLREFGPNDTTGGTVAGAYSNPPALGGYDSSWFKGTGGISIATVDTRPSYTGTQPPKTYFDGITIENNTIERVSETGIRIAQASTLAAYSNANQTAVVPNRNIVMRNNMLMGGLEYSDFGQLISPAFAPVSEYNIAHDWRTSGLEVTNTTDGIYQFNEIYNINHWSTTRTADDTAFDADLNSSNVIFQYNYAHDSGSAFLICDLQGNKTSYKPIIYRYNIAQNITNRLIYGGYGGLVYNNTFYSPNNDTRVQPDNNTVVSNNIFYVKSLANGGGTYKNNLYYLTDPLAADASAVVGNPQFVDPGKGETGTVPGQPKIDTLVGYKLKNTSPAIDTGIPIVNNGGRDFFGNPLYADAPDIGAHEYSDSDKPVDHVAYVELDTYKSFMNVQDTGTIKATVKPESVKNKLITFSSSDENIVTVSPAGVLTAVSPGTAKIIAASNSDPTITAECVIEVSSISNRMKMITPTDDGYVRGVNVASYSSIISQTADPNNLQIQNNSDADDGWNKKVLLQFPTSDLKDNLNDKTFILRIFAHKIEAVPAADAKGPYKTISVFPTNTGWSETTLKGSNRPARSQVTSIGTFNVPVSSSQVYSWFDVNVTDYMKTYLAGGDKTQVSFELSNESLRANTDSKYIEFTSKDSSDNMPPQLIVSSIPIQVPTNVALTTTVGTAPVLPATVDATNLANGSSIPVAVQWEPVDPSLYSEKGTFYVRGMISEPTYASLELPVIIKVIVEPKVLSVALDANKLYLNVGSVKTITSNVFPEMITNKSVTFASSNEGIATVSADGKITAVAEGTAIVTATSVSDPTVSTACDITVSAITSVADYPKQIFKATQDSYVRDRTNVENFGNDTFIHVKSANSAGFSRVGYVQFDISTFPSNSTLSAKLKLYGKTIDQNSKALTNLGVYETDSGWSETGINWTNRKPFKGSEIASFKAPTVPGSASAAIAQGLWYEVDITDFINTRLQTGLSLSGVSFGLAFTEFVNNNLSPSSAFNTGIQFSSRNDTAGDFAPRLELAVIPYSLEDDKTVRTTVGAAPVLLPTLHVRDTVTGLMNQVPVAWESIPVTRYANSGKFDVKGTFDYNGQQQIVIYTVIVEAPETKLLFNAGSGTVIPSVSTVTYGNTVGWMPTPVKAGYKFIGWNSSADGKGVQYHPLTVYTYYTDTMLYAQWQAQSYTLSFNAQGGAPVPTNQAVTFDALVGTLPVVTRSGYTFKGWNTVANGTGTSLAEGSLYQDPKDTNLYAIWEATTYQITFDTQSTIPAQFTKQVKYDARVGTIEPIDRVGYSFSGWNTVADGTGQTYTEATIYQLAGNLTLYAQWSAGAYTLNFDANGSQDVYANKRVSYGAPVGTLHTPIRIGYTFRNWNTANDGTGLVYTADTNYQATTDTLLFAVWDSNVYSLSFDAQGGMITPSSSVVSVTYATYVGTLPVATKTGYTFMEWNTVANGTGETYTNHTWYHTAEDSILYARWLANQYTLHFDAQGGEVDVSEKIVTYVAPVGVLPVPTRSEHIFIGWNTNQDGSGILYTNSTNYDAASDMRLYAIWRDIDHGGSSSSRNTTYTTNSPSTPNSILQDRVEVTTELEKDTRITTDVHGTTVAHLNIDARNIQTSLDQLKDGATLVITTPKAIKGKEGAGIQVNLQVEKLSLFTNKHISLELQTGNKSYILNAEEMLAQASLLFPNTSPSDISLTIVSTLSNEIETAERKREAEKQGYILLDSPVSFEVLLSNNHVDKPTEMFEKMVGRVLGETTYRNVIALRIQKDGSFVPVPIVYVNGKYVGMSLLNSTYVLAAAKQITFNDVKGNEAEASIQALASKYVVTGLPNGDFEPSRSVTRAEFVQMLTAALGLYDKGVTQQRFKDVEVEDWYADAVTRAVDAKLISGVTEDLFNPSGIITHEEVYAILGRTLPMLRLDGKVDSSKTLSSFGDAVTLSDWSVKSSPALVDLGIITGDKLHAKSIITRAEAAVFIQRLLEKAF